MNDGLVIAIQGRHTEDYASATFQRSDRWPMRNSGRYVQSDRLPSLSNVYEIRLSQARHPVPVTAWCLPFDTICGSDPRSVLSRARTP